MRTCSNPSCTKEVTAKDIRTRFCSKSCSAIVTNSLQPKRKPLEDRPCKTRTCNNRIPKSMGFCDDCRKSKVIMDRDPEFITRWLNGSASGSDLNGQLKRRCRKFLIEQANDRCTSPDCAVEGGWSVPNPTTGKVILTIEHKDGNWKNNTVDNLIVLCYNCHTLTPTFGALNIGNGAGTRGSGNRVYKNGPLV